MDRAADASQPVTSATIESPARTAWHVAAMVAVLAAVPAAVAPLFDGAESFFQMLSSAAGVCGWWTAAFRGGSGAPGGRCLWVPSLWRRPIGPSS